MASFILSRVLSLNLATFSQNPFRHVQLLFLFFPLELVNSITGGLLEFLLFGDGHDLHVESQKAHISHCSYQSYDTPGFTSR